ncbi:glyoxylase I family protein [Constrictibacter sp. MBR-5]|jgi:glyoxylase I family protein|uniref:VOC family protein n=1 Tax=Constrictibacter sp. MBR-5 TaxID=3156467 RepID=UPI00339513DB
MQNPPFRLRTLDHVVLRTRDMQRMIGFYTGVLGCRKEREVERIGLVQLRAGTALIDLVPGRSGDDRNLDHFALTIEPYDETALRTYLADSGVKVGESGSRYGAEGEGPSLYIEDPEGNVVELKGPPRPATAEQRSS